MHVLDKLDCMFGFCKFEIIEAWLLDRYNCISVDLGIVELYHIMYM